MGTRTWPGVGAIIYDETAQAAASADGDEFDLPPKKRGADEIVVQVDINGGNGDVMIEGRLDADAPWVPMLAAVIDEATSLTDEGLQALAYLPHIRAVTTNVSGTPNIRVNLYHG